MSGDKTTSGERSRTEDFEKASVLLSLYSDLNTEARWQEECRERSAAIIIGANSAIVGVIAAFKLQFPFIVFCLVQYLLAQAGQRFILKYHAISDRRHAYARGILGVIGNASGLGQQIEKVFADARSTQKERLKGASRLWRDLIAVDNVRIHELWYYLHGGFKMMSLLLAALIVVVDLQQGGGSYILWINDKVAPLLANFAAS